MGECIYTVDCCYNCQYANIDFDWAIDCDVYNKEVTPDGKCKNYEREQNYENVLKSREGGG